MKILIISKIDSDALEQLRAKHDVICTSDTDPQKLTTLIRDREALIFRSGVEVEARLMDAAPDLRLLVRAGSGTDNLDLDHATRRGLELVRIPEPGAKAVAEMAFALMLALARNLLAADRLTRQGRWAKSEMTGWLLTGKVLGVVGAGNIGSRTGALGAAWGMQVLGCVKHDVTAGAAAKMAEMGLRLTSFEEVLAASDFVSVHVPLDEGTRHLIDDRALSLMKPGAFLVNLARGGVVDEAALRQALVEGRLGGAALDVHAQEGEGKISILADLPNVILTPHVGAGTFDSQREIGRRVVEIVRSFSERRGGRRAVSMQGGEA